VRCQMIAVIPSDTARFVARATPDEHDDYYCDTVKKGGKGDDAVAAIHNALAVYGGVGSSSASPPCHAFLRYVSVLSGDMLHDPGHQHMTVTRTTKLGQPCRRLSIGKLAPKAQG